MTNRTSPIAQFRHGSSSKLDYAFDWSKWLPDGDTIAESTWEVVSESDESPALLLDSAPSIESDGTVTVVWLEDGTLHTRYRVTNRIVTDAGREDERSLIITIVDQ